MPTPTPHRNQSSNSQCKSVEWFQHKKYIGMKKANRNEISKPLEVTTTISVQRSEERCTELTVMSSNKQLMATTYKYSNNNNNK